MAAAVGVTVAEDGTRLAAATGVATSSSPPFVDEVIWVSAGGVSGRDVTGDGGRVSCGEL